MSSVWFDNGKVDAMRRLDQVPMAPRWAAPFMLWGYMLIIFVKWVLTKTGYMAKWQNQA